MFAALSIGRFLIIKGPLNLKLASFRFGISLGSLLPLCSLVAAVVALLLLEDEDDDDEEEEELLLLDEDDEPWHSRLVGPCPDSWPPSTTEKSACEN